MYQQVVVEQRRLQVLGEHVMGACGRLTIQYDFFGADEAITDYQDNKKEFRAILIIVADDWEKAKEKYCKCINQIRQFFCIEEEIE